MSIDKHEAVEHWQAQGKKIIGRRIKNIFGVVGSCQPALVDQAFSLLHKFSPIWHKSGVYNDRCYHSYVYSDASLVIIYLYHNTMHIKSNVNIARYMPDQAINKIYNKLTELGLIAAEVQHVHG